MPQPPLPDDLCQRAVDAFAQYGSKKAAAEALGIHPNTYKDRLKVALARGFKVNHGVPEHLGMHVKGVSTLYGADGEIKGQWVKEDANKRNQLEAFESAIEAACEDAKGLYPSTPSPSLCDTDLLTVIPLGDPHFGMRSWAKETGENFDLRIAERVTFEGIDRLCQMGPPSHEALLLNLGDYFHADNGTNRTPQSGNVLDVDGRFAEIAEVGFRAMVRCIARLKEKHPIVRVRNNRGNHDPHQAFMLDVAVSAMFHNDPRVIVERTPSSFFYHEFGNNLIGSTHGDGPKLMDLPKIMAADVPEMWGRTLFRVWHCGHFHHDQLKDDVGCTIETHRTLAATDAWHRWKGYRSMRDVKAITYHREYGEEERIRCGVRRLAA